MDEQELDRQKALQGWDEQSCAEYEAWLDEVNDDAQEPAEPPCPCYYTDVELAKEYLAEAKESVK